MKSSRKVEDVQDILQEAQHSEKYKRSQQNKKKKKPDKEEEKQTAGEQAKAIEQARQRRAIEPVEQSLLDRSFGQWTWLLVVNTPLWRLDRARRNLIEKLTDFNIQYAIVHGYYMEEKAELDDVRAKFKVARLALKEKIGPNPGTTLSGELVNELHKLNYLNSHIQFVDDNLRLYDHMMMNIVGQEMQINHALMALRATGLISKMNTEQKYATAVDLSFCEKMITQEVKTYVKAMKKNQPITKVLNRAAMARKVVENSSKVPKVTTQSLLRLLEDSPPPPQGNLVAPFEEEEVFEPREREKLIAV